VPVLGQASTDDTRLSRRVRVSPCFVSENRPIVSRRCQSRA
jgi:hypothetical protein